MCDIETLNKRNLAATPYSFSPSYAQALCTGMAAAGAGGAGNIGAGNNGGAAGGRGFGVGRGGGRTGGGGGVCGGRQDYGAVYDYNHRNDDGAHYNGQRCNPNLGAHPPNYGPRWEYERGRRATYGRNGARGWNGGYRQVHNFQRQRMPPQAPSQQRGPPRQHVPP